MFLLQWGPTRPVPAPIKCRDHTSSNTPPGSSAPQRGEVLRFDGLGGVGAAATGDRGLEECHALVDAGPEGLVGEPTAGPDDADEVVGVGASGLVEVLGVAPVFGEGLAGDAEVPSGDLRDHGCGDVHAGQDDTELVTVSLVMP
jgi:hypothetical protein